MRVRKSSSWLAIPVIAICGFQISCSTDTGPQPGSPAFYWAGAKQAFSAGDYVKTSDNLDHLLVSENEYTARARAMLLVISAGMVRGYSDTADDLETGVRAKHSDPGSFRKYISNYRSMAGRLSLHFAETFMVFQKTKDDPIQLDFNFPSGSAAPVPELARAMAGQPLDSTQIESAVKHDQDRMVLLETCSAVGAPNDSAKALEVFKSGSAQTPRSTFLMAMANSLYDQSQLYSAKKLDDPAKVKIFSNLASEALKSLPESKEAKELSAKIEKVALKK